MTTRTVVTLACVVLMGSNRPLLSHGGGLDNCGGHNDRKHGGYHVHDYARYCGCHPDSKSCASLERSPATSLVDASRTTRDVAGSALAKSLADIANDIESLECIPNSRKVALRQVLAEARKQLSVLQLSRE